MKEWGTNLIPISIMKKQSNSLKEEDSSKEGYGITEKINDLIKVVLIDYNLKSSYSWMGCKHMIEKTSSILLLIELIKMEIYEEKLNSADKEAKVYFNREVQKLMDTFVPLVLVGLINTEVKSKFTYQYKDFLIRYIPHILGELSELNPSNEFNTKDDFKEVIINHCAELINIFKMIAGQSEYNKIFIALRKYADDNFLKNAD